MGKKDNSLIQTKLNIKVICRAKSRLLQLHPDCNILGNLITRKKLERKVKLLCPFWVAAKPLDFIPRKLTSEVGFHPKKKQTRHENTKFIGIKTLFCTSRIEEIEKEPGKIF